MAKNTKIVNNLLTLKNNLLETNNFDVFLAEIDNSRKALAKVSKKLSMINSLKNKVNKLTQELSNTVNQEKIVSLSKSIKSSK